MQNKFTSKKDANSAAHYIAAVIVCDLLGLVIGVACYMVTR